MKIEEIIETEVEQQQEAEQVEEIIESESEREESESESESESDSDEEVKLPESIPYLPPHLLYAIRFAQARGFSVHIFDHNRRVQHCNKTAEVLYGHSFEECIGANGTKLLVDAKDYAMADEALERTAAGESCRGRFPVKNKQLQAFQVMATNDPFFYNDIYLGVVCISQDARHYQGGLYTVVRPKPSVRQVCVAFVNSTLAALRNKIWSTLLRLIRNTTVEEDEGIQDDDDDAGSSSSSASVNSVGATINSDAHDDIETHPYFLDLEIPFELLKFGDNTVELGRGSFGVVCYAKCWGNTEVAVKKFHGQNLKPAFIREVSIMKKLRHPNVVPLLGVVTSSERLWIVTELLSWGPLSSLLHNDLSSLDWRRRVQFALDIARGINYLHWCVPSVIHADLKSANVLVNKKFTLQINDFNLSGSISEMLTNPGRGTIGWMAPEVDRWEACDEKSDVYSFGILIQEIFTGYKPRENLSTRQVAPASTIALYDGQLQIPEGLDPRWETIIRRCLERDGRDRPSMEELVDLCASIKLEMSPRRIE